MKASPIALCLLLVASVQAAPDYPQATVDMQLQKVSSHLYLAQGKAGIATDNQGFISNAVAIVTDQGVVLVDALGTPSLAILLQKKLRIR